MEEVKTGRLTETFNRLVFRGPFARFRSSETQVLPPVVALIFEFAAFASIPLIFMAYLLLSNSSSNPASADLNGLWKTTASGYGDRYLEISDNVIMFGTGGDSLESYVIKSIESQPDGAKTLYTITYLDKDMNAFRLSLYYEPEGEPLITFKHQKHLVWTRAKE